jgi:hypothetical protein
MPCFPNSRTSTTSNLCIKASLVQTGGTIIRTVDLMHAISIYDARAYRPCLLASGHLDLNCDTCLMDECFRTGIHVVRMVVAIFPYLCLARNPEA